MRRRHYVVTYDISDDRHRNQVFRTMHGFGDHAQYSVFFCEMSEAEVSRLRQKLRDTIHHGEDQVLIVDLGAAVRPVQLSVEAIGKHYEPPLRTIVV
jgi:CRISPR-associated protein Cas2